MKYHISLLLYWNQIGTFTQSEEHDYGTTTIIKIQAPRCNWTLAFFNQKSSTRKQPG